MFQWKNTEQNLSEHKFYDESVCLGVCVIWQRKTAPQRVQFSGKIQFVGSKNLFSYSRFMQFNFPNLHHFKRLKCEWREKRHQRDQE